MIAITLDAVMVYTIVNMPLDMQTIVRYLYGMRRQDERHLGAAGAGAGVEFHAPPPPTPFPEGEGSSEAATVDPLGVVELLLRGYSIDEMAGAAKVPHIAIVRAMAEYGFDKLRHLHKALVLDREFRLEKLRTEAMERLHQMATNLSAEYPDGLKPDQARMLDVERRAIGSLLRLPPFPSLRDFWADMRPPTPTPTPTPTTASSSSRARDDRDDGARHSTNESTNAGSDRSGVNDDGGAWSLYNQSLQKRLRKHLEEREAGARAEAAKSPNETGATGSPRTRQPVGEELTACPAGEAVAPDVGDAVEDPGVSGRAGLTGGTAKRIPARHDHHGRARDATPTQPSPAEQGRALESADHREIEDCGDSVTGRNGMGLPLGLNRAARRRWLREQRREHKHNGHSRHPP
jgi:hypothetical protein